MNTNLLDINNHILEIFGDKVKQDNLKRKLVKEEQILKGKQKYFCLSFVQVSLDII